MSRDRDTDADWRLLGERDPYWGVISQPEFRRENLTDAAVERFYESGRLQVAALAEELERTTGARPGGRALDFGCGAGRMTEAMCDHAEAVTGYDVSPGMLAIARARSGRPAYVDALPDGPFDWINSYIVFQHIPAERGLAALEALLARLAPGGHICVQLTVWREPHLTPPPPLPMHLRAWHTLVTLGRRPPPPPPGAVMMYDYDLSAVLGRLHRAGVPRVTLIHTDHSGHHGVEILGRRCAA